MSEWNKYYVANVCEDESWTQCDIWIFGLKMYKGISTANLQVCMFITMTALLTWLVGGTEIINRKFHLVPNPTSGPQRVGQGWQEESLLHCALTCQQRYRLQCWSLMYNNSTHLCTPGKWLDDSQAPPSTAEGTLYLGYQCDTHMGFIIKSYNETPACILKFSKEATYAEASSSCSSLNSHLFTAKTLDKFNLMKTLVDLWMWVGLDDIQTEGELTWVDDGQVVDPDFARAVFHENEPNDESGFEDCVEIYIGTLKLNDNVCDKHFAYVCEQTM